MFCSYTSIHNVHSKILFTQKNASKSTKKSIKIPHWGKEFFNSQTKYGIWPCKVPDCIDRFCNLLSSGARGAWVRSWHSGVKGESHVSQWPLADGRVLGVQGDVEVHLGNSGLTGSCCVAPWGSLLPIPFIMLDPIYSRLCYTCWWGLCEHFCSVLWTVSVPQTLILIDTCMRCARGIALTFKVIITEKLKSKIFVNLK